MKRLLILTIIVVISVASSSYAIYQPQPIWRYDTGGSNIYYGSGVYDASGNIATKGDNVEWYAGKIGHGPMAFGRSSSAPVHDLTLTNTAKSIAPIGGKYFVPSDDYANHGGLGRIDDWSDTTSDWITTGAGGETLDCESATTDGTYLYLNHDISANRHKIAKYSVTTSGTFTATQQWDVAVASSGARFRALSYWDGAIYVVDYNASAGSTALYAVETNGSTHTLGAHQGIKGHQAYRYGDELFVVGREGGKLWVYDFTSQWTVDSANPESFDLFDADGTTKIGDSYGCGVVGNGQEATNIWVANASGGDVNYYELRHNGDADEDGDVDGNDLNVILGNWGQSGSSMTWAAGDFNGDDVVDGSDLNMLLGEWGWVASTAPAANVPEPATVLLTLVGFAGLLRKRS